MHDRVTLRVAPGLALLSQTLVRVLVLLANAFLACAPSPALAQGAYVLPGRLQAVAWRDSDGSEFRLNQAKAPLTVVTMAYTACKRICTSTPKVLADLQERFDRAGRSAEFVMVSFDPKNDSPREWADFRARRGLTRANWHFLSGDEGSTRQLARYLDLDFWSYHDHIVHNFRVVVFDAQWRSVAQVDWDTMDDLPRQLGLEPVQLAERSTSQRASLK